MGSVSGNWSPANGRWLVIALAAFYLLVLYGGASLKAEYSHFSQYISELNATGTAWSWQIGYLGFVPLGLLGLVLLLMVGQRARLSGPSRLGCWLLIAEPIVYVGSAFAPCDLNCPTTGSLSQNIHNLLSTITLVVTTAGLVMLYFNKSLPLSKRVGWLVLAGTFITLYALALTPDLAPWRGLLQRLAEGILYGSLCLVSWKVLSNPGQASRLNLANQDRPLSGRPSA